MILWTFDLANVIPEIIRWLAGRIPIILTFIGVVTIFFGVWHTFAMGLGFAWGIEVARYAIFKAEKNRIKAKIREWEKSMG